MPFNFPGPDKLLLLAIIALVVLGPSRLPQAARTAGKWVREIRKFTSRLQDEVSGALGEPKDAITAAVGDLRNEVGNWRNEMAGFRGSMTSAIPDTAAAARSSFGNGTGGAAGTSTSGASASGASASGASATGASASGASASGASASGASASGASASAASASPAVSGATYSPEAPLPPLRGPAADDVTALPPVPDDPSLN